MDDILVHFDDIPKLYTRHNNEVTSRFPELLRIDIPERNGNRWGDYCFGSGWITIFEAMISRFQSKRNILENGTLTYEVFDVIQYKGESVTHLPLMDRKQLLAKIIKKDTSLVTKFKYIEGYGSAYFDLIRQQGLEGIVLKQKGSRYEVGKRSHSWLKVINYQYEDVLLLGLERANLGFF